MEVEGRHWHVRGGQQRRITKEDNVRDHDDNNNVKMKLVGKAHQDSSYPQRSIQDDLSTATGSSKQASKETQECSSNNASSAEETAVKETNAEQENVQPSCEKVFPTLSFRAARKSQSMQTLGGKNNNNSLFSDAYLSGFFPNTSPEEQMRKFLTLSRHNGSSSRKSIQTWQEIENLNNIAISSGN